MKKTIKILIIVCVVLFIILIAVSSKQKDKAVIEEREEVLEDMNEYLNKERYDANEVYMANITPDQVVLLYYTYFKRDMFSDIEKAYKELDEEYSRLRFKDLDDFKKYVELNRNRYNSLNLTGYKMEDIDDYTLFKAVDQNNNYIYIKETAVMQYKIILDNYTIDQPEFIEKYNSCNTQERVILNIDKIRQAFDSKDYKYVYSKLSDGFKQRYYNTEESFESYISNIVYDNNVIQYGNFSNEGETYIYDIVLKNSDNEQEQRNMQIFMQLRENRDFVMSFNIK